MNDNIIIELANSFNDIIYYDEPHKYFRGDDSYTSVTTLIHKYQEEFNVNYWANYISKKYNIPVHQIIRTWDFINKKGTMKGSIIHDYAENRFLNKVFKYPKEEIIQTFGFDPIYKEYEITKNHVDNFINVSKNKLIPIKTELVVYDPELKISGMVDLLVYNVTAGEYQIWDHKTNKAFSFDNDKQYLKEPLNTLQDCDLNIYSLQLNLYKRIIERNTNIKLGDSYLIWFSHNNKNFKVIKTKDMNFYLDMILN